MQMRDISDLDDGEANSPWGYRHIPVEEENSFKQNLIDIAILLAMPGFFILMIVLGLMK